MVKGSKQEDIDAILPPSRTRPAMTVDRRDINFALLRDAVPTTWIVAVGGAIALGLDKVLPVHASLLLVLAVVLYHPLRAVLTQLGLLRNKRTARIVKGMYRGLIPGDPLDGSGAPSFAMVNLMVRTNSPIGILCPGFKRIADQFFEMKDELLSDPEKHGLLNLEGWVSTTRETCNTFRTVFYFDSPEAVWKFANGMLHKGAWLEYHRTPDRFRDVEISHEMFVVEQGGFESIYVNCEPNGAGELYQRKDGTRESEWVSTVRGIGMDKKLKDVTSRQRMGTTYAAEEGKAGPRPVSY